MWFHIQIVRESGSGRVVLHKATVEEMRPLRAKVTAATLLDFYSSRGANVVRVLNDQNEELYKL
jgi:hypothetical protein